ncbi:MAG: TIGR01212 family radical SAM protein [Oscillospiraceae bacterium]|nr:TIGR01212 family radical SAM protein [Oscillospiraceae bacterium]
MAAEACQNPFPNSDGGKRYYTWDCYLRRRYGGKVCKVPVNGGFTCPNLDGSCGSEGCSYCSDAGGGEFAGDPCEDVTVQFLKARRGLWRKWPGARAIAYFQAHTNTYAPVERLRELYEPVLEIPGVEGLSIATRPDALPAPVLDYLAGLARRTDLIVELGLQSAHDETARRIGRGHDFACFQNAVRALNDRGIPVCAHIIDGLPGETAEMMRETARQLARLPLHSVKIHLLHVLEGTRLAEEYRRGEFALLSKSEYISIVCDQLELLPPSVVVQRVTGDGQRSKLIGPLWSLRKLDVRNGIDKELARRGSWQGKFYQGGEAH